MDLKRFTMQIEDLDNRYDYYNGRNVQKAPHIDPISDAGVRMKIDILYKEYLSGMFRF